MLTGSWWTAWSLDPATVAIVGGLVALYLRGVRRRRERGVDRPRQRRAFLVGAGVVLLALLGPPAAFADGLFWPHMVQHLLLMIVAAPLLAAGAPTVTVRSALPPSGRRGLARLSRRSHRLRRAIGAPPPLVLATLVQIAVVWTWHVPAVYDAAVTSPALHLAEHATFLAAAVWFWSEVWATARRHQRQQALATLCLGAMIIQGGVLGALLTFASRSLFEVYVGGGELTAMEDQQLAGALMWVPPGFVYASVAVRRFIAWMHRSDSEQRAREARARA